MRSKDEEKTQLYSTWGHKLQTHTDVLQEIRVNKNIQPLTIQLAPTERCSSSCPFCSVAGRPIKNSMPFDKVEKVLTSFKHLGALSLELTGGGSSLLYNDVKNNKNINDIIELASNLGYEIGIIDNNHSFKLVKSEMYPKISWWRVSLIQLDEGYEPEDYDFNGFPYEKLAFSYIIYDSNTVDPFYKGNRKYNGTTEKSIEKIAKLVNLHPKIKFVRIAGDCLIKNNNTIIREQYKDIIESIDLHDKFFIKSIDSNDGPFDNGCMVGLIRPYVASTPDGTDYRCYICTSHVLNTRTYDLDYSLCGTDDIIETWAKLNENFKTKGYPYEVKGNNGCGWKNTCKFCYYHNNNELLYTVANADKIKDRNFV
jgi:hypothetical protein